VHGISHEPGEGAYAELLADLSPMSQDDVFVQAQPTRAGLGRQAVRQEPKDLALGIAQHGARRRD